MKTLLTSAALLMAGSTAALACPSFMQPGQSYQFTGDQLLTAQSAPVVAGGAFPLQNCGIPGLGYANQVPAYSLILSGMDNYSLDMSVVSECDATLLVNTVNTTWMFDDDSNGNLDPRMTISGAEHLNGRVDVWVGTYGGNSCNAQLTIQTGHDARGARRPVVASPRSRSRPSPRPHRARPCARARPRARGAGACTRPGAGPRGAGRDQVTTGVSRPGNAARLP